MNKAIVNLVISAIWLYVFSQLHWITFTGDMPLMKALLLSTLVTWAVTLLMMIAFQLAAVMTCGMAALVMPVYMLVVGWYTLLLTSSISHWYKINIDFWWLGLVMGIWFGYVRFQPIFTVSVSQSSE